MPGKFSADVWWQLARLLWLRNLSFSPPFRAPAWVLQRFCACNKRLFSLIRLKPRVLFMLASYHRLPITQRERERSEREKRRERRENIWSRRSVAKVYICSRSYISIGVVRNPLLLCLDTVALYWKTSSSKCLEIPASCTHPFFMFSGIPNPLLMPILRIVSILQILTKQTGKKPLGKTRINLYEWLYLFGKTPALHEWHHHKAAQSSDTVGVQ